VPLRLLLWRLQAAVSGLRVREHLLEPGVGRPREGVVSAEPLTREARALLVERAHSGLGGMTDDTARRLVTRYEATVQEAEERLKFVAGQWAAEVELERERAERLAGALVDITVMTPLISLLEDAIQRNPDRANDKHAIGLTLVSGRSPGPVLGIRCKRLGPVRDGTAWAIPARSLDKALENLRAALAVHAAEEER